jgi:hypothetical protein
MTTKSTLGAAVVAALAVLCLAGCDRDTANSADRNGATVGQKLDSAIDRTQQKLAEVGQKTEDRLDAVGQKIAAASDVKVDVRSGDTGRAINDTAITASVKTDLLKDPDLSVLQIDVDTKDGVVTLNGLAANDAARTRAEKMASAVKGVREVRNFLVIKRA